jgi:ubiquinone biosynthesis protein UbiJ
MLLNPLALKLVNLVLISNTGSRELLGTYYGKTFKLIFPGFSLSAKCDLDGYLINNYNEINYDVVINIPIASATFLIDQDKLAVYKKITFTGDANFGHELLEILSKLHLDGIYTQVNSPLKLMLLNKFTGLIKAVGIYIMQLGIGSSNTLKEYLMYETQDIITHFEHEEFCNNVDNIRARSEQLEQQIKELQKSKDMRK